MELLWFDTQLYVFGCGIWDPQFASSRIQIMRAGREWVRVPQHPAPEESLMAASCETG